MPRDLSRKPGRPARVAWSKSAALLGLASLALLTGCDGRWAARAELERRQIGLGKEPFLDAVKRGDAETVRLFLRAGLGRPGGLVAASWNGHCELLAELLASGLDARGPLGAEALVRAEARGHRPCVERLAAAGASVDAAERNGETLLIRAARERQPPARLRRLLDLGADPRAATKAGVTALMHAASGDGARSARLLLAAGAEVAARDLDGWTALHYAARAGSAGGARALLRKGAEVDARSALGWTPLQLAARGGALEVVEELLAAGAEPDAASRAGQTALIQAVLAGQAEVVSALLGGGADPSVAVDGADAFWWAVRGPSRSVAALLPRPAAPSRGGEAATGAPS